MKLTNFTEDYLFLLEQGCQPKIDSSFNFLYMFFDDIEIDYFIRTEKRKDIWIPALSGPLLYTYDTIHEKDPNMFDPKVLSLIKEMLSSSVL